MRNTNFIKMLNQSTLGTTGTPHYQKIEIEKLMTDLLEAAIIRPSTSPYCTPVLLVKKKDGT